MAEYSGPEPPIIVVCDPARAPRIVLELERANVPFRHIDGLGDLIRFAFVSLPAAVIVDVGAGSSFDSADLGVLTGLRLSWPLLACRPLEDGTVMAALPDGKGPQKPLLQALAALRGGDPEWRSAAWDRRHARLPFHCRVRFRTDDSQAWRLGTTLDLTTGGCFIVCYEALAVGSKITLELSDIRPVPHTLPARVVWTRAWNDSSLLPGMGVSFDGDVLSEKIIHMLGDPARINELIVNPK